MIQFRASSCGKLMVKPKNKKDLFSETTKKYLNEVMVFEKYGRTKEIESRYIRKGLQVEEDSITLYSRYKKTFFAKNELSLSDGYLKGTPDLYEGERIVNANRIIDIKSSWDIYTFFNTKNSPINPIYYWQLQAYMYLTGAKDALLAYCLISTPEVLVNDIKRRLMWDMGATTEESEEYQKACSEIDKLHNYDDIAIQERVYEVVIQRNDQDIECLLKQCEKANNYLSQILN